MIFKVVLTVSAAAALYGVASPDKIVMLAGAVAAILTLVIKGFAGSAPPSRDNRYDGDGNMAGSWGGHGGGD